MTIILKECKLSLCLPTRIRNLNQAWSRSEFVTVAMAGTSAIILVLLTRVKLTRCTLKIDQVIEMEYNEFDSKIQGADDLWDKE